METPPFSKPRPLAHRVTSSPHPKDQEDAINLEYSRSEIVPRFLRLNGEAETGPHLTTSKRVFLIRHGQSLAQKSSSSRQTDMSLRDCGLSTLGIQQAKFIPELLGPEQYESIELVVSSPLTRALYTALLAFCDKPILVHYDLREVGSHMPENQPRRMKTVLDDLSDCVAERTASLDTTTLEPKHWPKRHDTPPKVVHHDRIRKVFSSYLVSRPESVIAVVCHFHVIRAALWNPYLERKPPGQLKPMNADPIPCLLMRDGTLQLDYSNETPPAQEEVRP